MVDLGENISYEYLFDLLRREKTREDLQSIDKDFYKNIFSNINKREKLILEKQSQTSLVTNVELEKEKIEVKNIRKVAQEIMDRRQKKIIFSALSRARIPGTIINNDLFTKKEEEFFNKSVELFRSFKYDVENSFVNLKNVDKEDKQEDIDIKKQESKPEKELEVKKQEKEIKKEGQEEEQEPKLEKELKTQELLGETVKVEFLSEMSKFYGPSKEILGPYEKGQIAEVPEIIANVLIKKGRAKVCPKSPTTQTKTLN